MSFNSFEYLFFLPVVFILYWKLRSYNQQNIFLLVANYFFYGWFSVKFLLLIFFCSYADFLLGLSIYDNKKYRKLFLSLSIVMNLGLLFIFKYYNFFIQNSVELLGYFHLKPDLLLLNIIQPIGLSFFTFQTMGYNIDIYHGKLKPTKNVIVFLNFTSFFPQMFAGPIERGNDLIPQFERKRIFDYELAADGMRQILYGLFKKMVIADKLAVNVNYIFLNYRSLSSVELLLGSIFFYIQIYCDFSGYSDIAIGTGKLLGIKLSTNFRTPFFSKTPREAWSRWNMTLTAWFRDYVYMPMLYKNRSSTLWRIFCTLVLLMLIGFWHGPNWTFIVFGLLNGLYFIPHIISKRNTGLRRKFLYIRQQPALSGVSIFLLFLLGSVTTVFFRSPDVTSAINYIRRLFGLNIGEPPLFLLKLTPLLIIFLAWEWFQRQNDFQFNVASFSKPVRIGLYYLVAFLILLFGIFVDQTFIYFHF